MAYCTQTEIEAEIPAPHLVDALDDDGDGLADAGKLDQVIANAGSAVDGLVGGGVELPMAEPYPASVRRAALVFACETIYRRRQVPEEQNPFKKESDQWRKFLGEVGAGKAGLDQTVDADADWGSGTRVKRRDET